MFRTGLFVLAALSIRAQTIDLPKLAAEIHASYYHPDALKSLDCEAAVDWDGFAKSLKLTSVAEDRMNVIKGAVLKVHSARGSNARAEIRWGNGDPVNKETIETGLQQIVSSLFQIYWQFVTGDLGPAGRFEAEQTKDGGFIVTSAEGESKGILEVDQDRVPVKLVAQTPVVTSTIRTQFVSIPDQPRRLSGLDIRGEMGTNVFEAHLAMDYQDAGAFHIPRHVRFETGSLVVALELTNCSAQ